MLLHAWQLCLNSKISQSISNSISQQKNKKIPVSRRPLSWSTYLVDFRKEIKFCTKCFQTIFSGFTPRVEYSKSVSLFLNLRFPGLPRRLQSTRSPGGYPERFNTKVVLPPEGDYYIFIYSDIFQYNNQDSITIICSNIIVTIPYINFIFTNLVEVLCLDKKGTNVPIYIFI